MANQLVHLEEFKEVLAHYHIAPAGREVLRDVKLALLMGTSATGRDTLINELLQTGHYYPLASDTTRQPRVNNGIPEQNGREYWFRTEAEFLADLRAGRLLEAEIIHNQQVSGISIRELAKAYELGKTAITNVDLNLKAIVSVKPDTNAFLVLPPSFAEWMRRLDSRGNMPHDEKQRRLETALKVYRAGLEWDFFTLVINDDLAAAVAEVDGHIKTGKINARQHEHAHVLLHELLAETQAWLKQHP